MTEAARPGDQITVLPNISKRRYKVKFLFKKDLKIPEVLNLSNDTKNILRYSKHIIS